jgi:hypothetical protein
MKPKHFPLNDWLPIIGAEKSVILFKVWLLSRTHGFCYASQNTIATQCGIKLRHFKDLFKQLRTEHFFQFHAKPVLRKPLKISLSEKAFFPKMLLVQDTHQVGAPDVLSLVHHMPSNIITREETIGLEPADAAPPVTSALSPRYSEEQLKDPTFGFHELEHEASQRLCDDLKAIKEEFDIRTSRAMWNTWLQENPKGFISRCSVFFDFRGVEEQIIKVLQSIRPNTITAKRR